jgi:hypothetical protein
MVQDGLPGARTEGDHECYSSTALFLGSSFYFLQKWKDLALPQKLVVLYPRSIKKIKVAGSDCICL